jgi:hypothetical protein
MGFSGEFMCNSYPPSIPSAEASGEENLDLWYSCAFLSLGQIVQVLCSTWFPIVVRVFNAKP